MTGTLCAYLQYPDGLSAQSGPALTATEPGNTVANPLGSMSTPPDATLPTATDPSPATDPSLSESPQDSSIPEPERLYAPEVWRLPDVAGNSPPPASAWIAGPATAPYQPAALTLPPTETFPLPSGNEKPPLFNAPMSLSGVLTDGLQVAPPTPPPKIWEGSFTLGLDGSEGNSETMNFRFGCAASRKTDTSVLTANIDYKYQTAATLATTDRLYFDGRGERLLKDSRWSLFVHETVEYDKFQPFDVRDTSDAGVGYRWLKNENTTFITRLGAGFSHEYGGPEDGQYVPEAVFGLQLEHQISKRQRIVGVVEYAPDIGDFQNYRIRTQAAWDLLLDMERNLSLRVGVLERYNSIPNGARPNDLDYALMLMWKF